MFVKCCFELHRYFSDLFFVLGSQEPGAQSTDFLLGRHDTASLRNELPCHKRKRFYIPYLV